MIKIRKESMKQAIKYYIETEDISVKECSDMFNVDRGTLRRNLKAMNIETNRRLKKFNDKFFEVIDTEEKAYWLGFLLADGSICKNQKWEIGFGSSYEMINYISNHLSKELKIAYKEPKKNCIYRIRYSSNADIEKIIDYLYKDATVYLDRKHEKADSFCRPKTKPLKS